MADPAPPDAATLARRVLHREMSARESVEGALARIAAADGALRAFCCLRPAEAALAEADAVDAAIARGEAVGPLAGVPVAIKDLICTADLPTTFGSPLYDGFRPEEDDIAVVRLRRAGAIVVGKTNCSEFGYGPVGHNPLFPTTRNPWDLALTPGGSSAGSAVAVAAGMVPLALGSDGGGSIRIPAALTGLVGFKASWGRVPLWPGCRDERYPGASGWEALEHVGPMARTVRDCALAMSVLAGPSPLDRHSLPDEGLDWLALDTGGEAPCRIAFGAPDGAPLDPEVAAICAAAADTLCRALGAELHIAMPDTGPVQDVFDAIVAMETDRSGLRRMAAETGYRFGGALADVLDRPWTAEAFTAAILGRKRIVNRTARFMAGFDLFLTPTVAVPAFPADRDAPADIGGKTAGHTDWTRFSALANLTGCPAISVPVGLTAAGLPVGLQLMGRHLADLRCLRAAFVLERQLGLAPLRPPDGRLAMA